MKRFRLWYDIESRSSVPIKQGNKKYATDVDVIMAQWAWDDDPPRVEDLTALPPSKDLTAALEAVRDDPQLEIWAHVAEFDRVMSGTTWWFPAIPLERWRCTAALARMHGLPGGLDKLCEIFKIPQNEAKDKRGHDLIMLFCVPNAAGGYNDRKSHPVQWAEFLSYGRQDIPAMRAVWRKMPKWNSTPRMWRSWRLDQKMNTERGVRMDCLLAQNAVTATTKAKRSLAKRTAAISCGLDDLESTTQRARLLAFMERFGVTLPDLTADTVERRLQDESLPKHIHELLRIRQQASKASTAKYQRVINQHVGGRLFNLLVFCGAARTGRWAGRTLQPQNLPRPKHEQWEIEAAIGAFHEGTIEAHSNALYRRDDVLGLASSCLRGLIIAAPGRKLVVSDFANIEGRDMAWVAGEEWKLDAFRAFDNGTGPDLYKVAYARAFNIDPYDIADEGDWRRQIGKVMELALQYYGGVGAFCAMAETYGLDLDKMAAAAWPVIPAATKRAVEAKWDWAVKHRRTYDLAKPVWLACQALVTLWRQAHPAIVGFWGALDDAVKAAIARPGVEFEAGRVVIDKQQAWLRVRLPSGRYLLYPASHMSESGESFLGVNPYTKQWGRITTYSGKRAENIVQGIAADHMMDGLLAADDAGYNPVLSVHDEAITEPPDDPRYNDKDLSRLLVSSSLWAEGLPLTAKGFTSPRYRK